MSTQLATSRVQAQLSNSTGRAIVSARGHHHFVVDSTPVLGGPNEEINPLELILSALATCAIFLCETASREQGFPLRRASAAVEGDFDPRGATDPAVSPHLQAFRVRLTLEGPSQAQAEALVEAFRQRCTIFTTLVRAAPIEIELVQAP